MFVIVVYNCNRLFVTSNEYNKSNAVKIYLTKMRVCRKLGGIKSVMQFTLLFTVLKALC